MTVFKTSLGVLTLDSISALRIGVSSSSLTWVCKFSQKVPSIKEENELASAGPKKSDLYGYWAVTQYKTE